ncbi:wd-40 repeat protein [Stylonychia lemnae]|uniref:Wd-40 repeat protein n=1 Tax=Stylonychia lemnae TaxID=5949 RepID=A0A078BBX1_STYLE|nr:wd-40 repeat protein [Stylonychia lemnae]|eukprot:CDW91093.1 wd-40 repeat protein [Stylonychia lemnae]
MFQNNLIALETIIKQLSLKDKESIPILICSNLFGNLTPLDFSIKNHQQKIINTILSVILKYQDHLVFNQLIDKNLCELIKQQIDLQEYFDSNLPQYQILDPQFTNQHSDERELIIGINLRHPKDIHQKYDDLLIKKLSQLSQNEDDPMVSIEYHMINLPITLQNQPTKLMKVLSESDKPEYFENKIIQSIINFKWNQYTKSFYQQNFQIYLIFMVFFIFDIFYTTYTSKQNDKIDEQLSAQTEVEETRPNIWVKTSTKIICSIVLLYFLIHEIRQIRIQKSSYFSDGWNYFDFFHIISFATFCIMEFTVNDKVNLILIEILVIILSFMKLFFFLRIYDGFSFLVQMMAGVFKDIKYFISFFLIMILQFGMILLVLFKAEEIDEYNGVNGMAYFLMAFRISSGDFQLDNYQNQGSLLVIVSWIIWISAVFTLNIVFMNFIIAVISESYERVMQKLVAESYKVKANMIVEREQLFTSSELLNKEMFPNYIVIRGQINNNNNESGEWQGFIKDLKYTIRTSAAKSKQELIQNNNSQYSKISSAIIDAQTQKHKKNSKNDEIQVQFGQLKQQLLENDKENKENYQKLANEMDFIKSQISQILKTVQQ